MSKAILVAGMHRSGTSATTGGLRMCGVSLGSELIPAAADNRLGYWENLRAVSIHERLLERLERSWDDVRELPRDWLQSDAARAAEAQIENLIRDEFSSEPLWAIKDPRICRFVPLWREVLARMGIPVVVLMVVRRPSEVAASIQKRNGWMPALSELLWLRHVFEAERHSRDLRRCVVTYDDILASPRETIFRALERLGVATAEVSSPIGDLESFISGEERHHAHALESASSSGISEEAFDLLASIAKNNQGWDALSQLGDAFQTSSVASSRYIEALADSAWKLRQFDKESREATAAVTADLNAQIAWSEQAVLREQELQADLAHARENFNAQVQWSEEAVERRQRLEEELAQVRSDLLGQIRWSEEAVERRRELEQALVARTSELEATESANKSLSEELVAVRAKLAAIQSSLSWKLTAPVRAIERLCSPKSTDGFNSR